MWKTFAREYILPFPINPAMDHAGIGATHVNHFLTTLNIPAMDSKVLQRQEKQIGAVVEQVAKESCDQALAEEVEKTDDSARGITMSFDCGWQKRGRAMNSLTGVGHAMGNKTRKVRKLVHTHTDTHTHTHTQTVSHQQSTLEV